ncbi:MAG TPA: hypothetical protein VGJ26_06120 [Pirellulales bacterium]
MRTSSLVAAAFFWSASLYSTASLFAQEELPPPPPKPAAPATKPAAPKQNAAQPSAARQGTAKQAAPKQAAPKQIAPNQTAPRQFAPFIPGPGFFGPMIPPPPPAVFLSQRRELPPEVRARRERLRAMGAQAIDAFLPPDGSGPAGADGARIGAAVRPLAQAILGDGLIETLNIKIDPKGTNLREDRVKLDSVANLRQTPWADDPSKFASQVSVRVVAGEGGSPMAVVDGKFQFQTQTVPLMNFALAQYKQRSAEKAKEPADGPLTSEDVLSSRINAKLQTVDAIRSIDEVADLMNQFAEIRLSVVNEQIEELRAAMAMASDVASRKECEEALTAARIKRDRLLEVRSKTTRGKDGAAESIALKLAMLDLVPGADMQTFDVVLSDKEITATVVGNVYQYVDFYPLAKPVVIATLERIQAGDAQAVETVRRAINVFLSQGLKPLLPETQASEAVPAPGPPAPDAPATPRAPGAKTPAPPVPAPPVPAVPRAAPPKTAPPKAAPPEALPTP